MPTTGHLFRAAPAQPVTSLLGRPAYYATDLGAAVLGDSLEIMRGMPDHCVNLVITSPPYALHFKKEYGNADQSRYIEWLVPFAREIRRLLTDDGSFILNVGGAWTPGQPTRSIYTYKLLVELVETVGLHLAQEFFWYNPAKMPVPAEWVTVRRIRVKDSVEFVWWFGKTPWPKADNRAILRAYSRDMIRLNQRGVRRTKRPGGHAINEGFATMSAGGSIPPNVIDEDTPSDLLKFGNNAANDKYTMRCKAAGAKIHPARFPAIMPELFIKLCTDHDEVVLDPFAGSNTSGMVAEALDRRWIAIESNREYLDTSRFRFESVKQGRGPDGGRRRGRANAERSAG